MRILWLAYLFSQKCSAKLEEFFELQQLLLKGKSLLDPELEEVSPAWRELKCSAPEATNQISFKIFCQKIRSAQKRGICVTHPGQADFPQQFLILRELPFFLTYLGHPIWMTQIGFSVVGSREPSAESEAWCEVELSKSLKSGAFFTVSGGARGVDQICHRVSIRLGQPTLVLLPSGLDCLYPSSLEPLVRPILESKGALLSEYLPETVMQKQFFPRRNRLIAGMGQACLIIEARHRSGTLITAMQAAEQSKPLFVLPSHPYDSGAKGGLDLMMEGATPVRNAEDLISYLSAECKGISSGPLDIVAHGRTYPYG